MAAAVRARAQQVAQQVQKTLVPLYERSEKQAVQRYKKLMEENQHYVVKDKEAADKLLKQYVFTSLSRSATVWLSISHALFRFSISYHVYFIVHLP